MDKANSLIESYKKLSDKEKIMKQKFLEGRIVPAEITNIVQETQDLDKTIEILTTETLMNENNKRLLHSPSLESTSSSLSDSSAEEGTSKIILNKQSKAPGRSRRHN
jgi:hypothetical protein